MTSGLRPKRRNRRHVAMLDPQVYQADRIGFLRGLRAIHRAAELGRDTSGWYLIVEYDRVVGVGGQGVGTSVRLASTRLDSSTDRDTRSIRDGRSGR